MDLSKIVFVPKTPTANCFSDDTLSSANCFSDYYSLSPNVICGETRYDVANGRYTINEIKRRSLREITVKFQIK